jgi:RND family efflux transporter MFP subunit
MKSNSTILLALIFGLILEACKPNYPQPDGVETESKSVVVEALTLSDEPVPLEVSGVLSSKIEARLSFKLAGVVDRILVDEGQKVKKGQLLAHLNLAEINAQVVQAQNAVDKAARDFERIQNLYQDSVATLEQLQDLETQLEVSQADLRIARFNQQYARIVSPTDGKVFRRFAEQGELVSAGTPVITVGSHGYGSYVMRISLSDVDVVKLAYNDSANISFDAYPGISFPAFVTEIAEAADPLTGTFEIELTLEPNERIIKSGFIGKAFVYPSNQQPYYRISLNALVEGHEQTASVFFYNEVSGKAELTELQPMHIDNTFFTVLAEQLPADKKVITDGSAYLQHGEIVNHYSLAP